MTGQPLRNLRSKPDWNRAIAVLRGSQTNVGKILRLDALQTSKHDEEHCHQAGRKLSATCDDRTFRVTDRGIRVHWYLSYFGWVVKVRSAPPRVSPNFGG